MREYRLLWHSVTGSVHAPSLPECLLVEVVDAVPGTHPLQIGYVVSESLDGRYLLIEELLL